MFFTLQTVSSAHVKRLLLCALGFSLIGDIILTLPIKTALPIGILAFMATHCTYIGLFFKNMKFQRKGSISFLPVLAFVTVGFYFLSPYLGEMKIPVTIYLCLLTLMVFCSFQVKQQIFLIRIGATLFLLSDFILALDLFILPSNKPTDVLIMLLYYMAQLLLVLGITETKQPALLELERLLHKNRIRI
jgi:uncharacterized membrane protein YhhN